MATDLLTRDGVSLRVWRLPDEIWFDTLYTVKAA
jgi:hypothetical protein